ncbi:MAG: nickel pincer cofactor biosynthesis protein LarC [Candidatus Glassbacteria bacterium]|nr:nickel pincer cofactor biosynthesis protein LarC [Candidatus Glassbacteria bacterium]
MKTAYFDMFSGVSGDMVLGALVDNGFPGEKLQETVTALSLEDVRIEIGRDQSHGIMATRVEVHAEEGRHHRGLKAINAMIEKSSLPDEVTELACRIFLRLGEAEAAVHGVELESIHFHEVGALDSIVDIVGAAAGLVHLGIERCYAGPFRFGTGFVEFSHGRLALPVPAVARLTSGCPVEHTDVEAELTTPTGAAIVTTVVKPEDFKPAGTRIFNQVGYGLGSRKLKDRPNLLRLHLGEQTEPEGKAGDVAVLECNIDDMNPEYYEHLMETLFAAGALDVFLVPVQMKKNRPAVWLNVLAEEKDVDTLSNTILENTSAIGLRYRTVSRITLERSSRKIKTPWGEVTVKEVRLPSGELRVKPEYNDLKILARKTGDTLLGLAGKIEAYLRNDRKMDAAGDDSQARKE